jgi:separase
MTAGKSSLSMEEKEAWWKQRFELDSRMSNLIADIESEWIGPARGFMLPVHFEESGHADRAHSTPTPWSRPLERAFSAALARCPSLFTERDIEEVSRLLCKEGSEAAGLAKSLLREFRSRSPAATSRVTRARVRTRVQTVAVDLILALDTELERLPWEALKVFRTLRCGITRLPHASFAAGEGGSDWVGQNINPERVFYMLNPSADLVATQGTFQPRFESQVGWRGLVGADPKVHDVNSILRRLEESDVFLYCGHGGGEAYLPPRQLGKVNRMPVCVLMGCSSGRLEQYSEQAESSGTAMEYLLAGAPAVVGNLWDVSDRDIDRLTNSFLYNWLGLEPSVDTTSSTPTDSSSGMTMATALAHSREACRLPFLVGASTVIYGRANVQIETRSHQTGRH